MRSCSAAVSGSALSLRSSSRVRSNAGPSSRRPPRLRLCAHHQAVARRVRVELDQSAQAPLGVVAVTHHQGAADSGYRKSRPRIGISQSRSWSSVSVTVPPEIRTDTTSSGSVQFRCCTVSRTSGWPTLHVGHSSASVHATQIGVALTVIEPSPETTSAAGADGSQETADDSWAALPGAGYRDPPSCTASPAVSEIAPSGSRSSIRADRQVGKRATERAACAPRYSTAPYASVMALAAYSSEA